MQLGSGQPAGRESGFVIAAGVQAAGRFAMGATILATGEIARHFETSELSYPLIQVRAEVHAPPSISVIHF